MSAPLVDVVAGAGLDEVGCVEHLEFRAEPDGALSVVREAQLFLDRAERLAGLISAVVTFGALDRGEPS